MTGAPAPGKAGLACDWKLISSAGTDSSVLREISEFRGRILYADGRRPRFRLEDGEYADDDPLDSQSFHVTVRTGGYLIGCLRLRSLPEYSQSSFGRLVTRRQFEAALEEMRLTPGDCLEVSRWIVAPGVRGTTVAPHLVVSAWAIGRWLDKRRLLATVGRRDGQARVLTHLGGQVMEAIGAQYIAEYDDEVSAMCFELDYPPPPVAARLRGVERLLALQDNPCPTESVAGCW